VISKKVVLLFLSKYYLLKNLKNIDMNETIKTIYERRAVRKYDERPIEKALINEVIEAGRMAPSAINMQPWKFYVLTNKELINRLSKEIARAAAGEISKMKIRKLMKLAASFFYLSHGLDFLKLDDAVFHGAPAVIFISSPKTNEWADLDIGMCSQNIMLAAQSLGLASCPIGFAKYVEKTKSYKKLGIAETEQVIIAVIIGYGLEKPEPKIRLKDNLFFIE
jgi:nitroreductase